MSRPMDAHLSDPTDAYELAGQIGEFIGTGLLSMEQGERILHHVKELTGRPNPKIGQTGASNFLGFSIRMGQVMKRAADTVAMRNDSEFEDARKMLGPIVVRGKISRDAAIQRVRASFPLLLLQDVEILVDEETAWWLRWRHDRSRFAA